MKKFRVRSPLQAQRNKSLEGWTEREFRIDSGNRQRFLGSCSPLSIANGIKFYSRRAMTEFRFDLYDPNTLRQRSVIVTKAEIDFNTSVGGGTGLASAIEVAFMKMNQGDITDSVDKSMRVFHGQTLDKLIGVQDWSVGASDNSFQKFDRALDQRKTLIFSVLEDTEYFVNYHSYRVIDISHSGVTLLNPWGIDGRKVSGSDDGLINISFAELSQTPTGMMWVSSDKVKNYNFKN